MGITLNLVDINPAELARKIKDPMVSYFPTREEGGLFQSSSMNWEFIKENECETMSIDFFDENPYYRPTNLDSATQWIKDKYPEEEMAIQTLEKMKEKKTLWLEMY